MKNYEVLNILYDDLENTCSRKFENCTKINYQDILDLIDRIMKKYNDKYTEEKEDELYEDLKENIIESLCFE
jgi:ribosome assembly protein YihI (activator of Der GTPase)